MKTKCEPAIWFPTVRTHTGTDVFTERLAERLNQQSIPAEITWLPLRAEYAPWTVPVPAAPAWATIAHVNTWLHPRFLPRSLHIVATLHHSVHDPALRPYKGFARAMYHRFWIARNERRVVRHAARVIAVSQFVAATARQTLLDMPMDVIHNGVDTQAFRPGDIPRKGEEVFRLLYVGSWMARKGVDLLAPIMRGLGDGFELRYTGGAAVGHDRRNMPPSMYDIGRLAGDAAVAAAMHEADALLFPSRSEGLPLVVIEAMACGLPVICTHGSSLVEVVEHGVTGMLCPQDDVAAFVAAARLLATEPGLAQRMGDAARAHAVGQLAEDGMVAAYIRAYREALLH